MKLLLDTHVLLWWLDDAKQLGVQARACVADPENLVFVSAASVWEIRIKAALGKLSLPKSFHAVLANQHFERLPITWEHANAVADLPQHHRDPFDRMLIAQAMTESLVLVTHDQIVKQYAVETLFV